ncbi:MAG: hypothetical protein PHG97_02745 [Candidatus Margulisbacteria bacterium]|nr:hypothetical protein [Candidatus Margulisiibacteriota bacterium]
MTLLTTPAYVPKNASLYFHRVNAGENMAKIAAKYNVQLQGTDGISEPKPGEIVVIDLKASTLSFQ